MPVAPNSDERSEADFDRLHASWRSYAALTHLMDCRVKPGNDRGGEVTRG